MKKIILFILVIFLIFSNVQAEDFVCDNGSCEYADVQINLESLDLDSEEINIDNYKLEENTLIDYDSFSEEQNSGYIIEFEKEPAVEIYNQITSEINKNVILSEEIKEQIKNIDNSDTMSISKNIYKSIQNIKLNGINNKIKNLKETRQSKINNHKEEIIKEHKNFINEFRKLTKKEPEILDEFDSSINGLLMTLSSEEVEIIQDIPLVKKISLDKIREIDLTTSVGYINADSVWGLDDDLGNKITGKNVTIAILDTGVDYTHPDLGGCFGSGCKVIGGYDIYNNDSNPMDDNGHGTHVASTAAGNGVLKGVAPDALIYSYKVCSRIGSCPESDIIAGIERAMDPNQDGNYDDHVDIISISLGGPGTPDDPDALAVDSAFDVGIFVSISAGNSGPRSQTIGCPACARKSTAVAAWCKSEDIGVDPRCNEEIASFSSRGPVVWEGGSLDKPDISAPGVNICAAQWSDAWSTYECIDSEHTSISGTSMAAPHVSGVAALVKQAHPDWDNQQIKDSIMQTATNLGLNIHTQGAGLIDALNSVLRSNTFPKASIDLFGKIRGNVEVIGTASGVNFTDYILEYSDRDQIDWITIYNSSEEVVHDILGQWDTSILLDDLYALRLRVSNSFNETNQKIRLLEVDNVYFAEPEKYSWVAKDSLVNITGTVQGADFKKYIIEYNSGKNPTSWITDSIILEDSGLQQKFDQTLGMWNTSVINSTGFYTLRLTAEFDDGRIISEQRTVYIDIQQRKGFPKKAGYDIRSSSVPVDLDNDGKKEILQGSSDGYVYAFREDGTSQPGWPVYIGPEPILSTPAVADLDNDGFMEVVVASKNYYNLYAFNHDGTPLSGWPVYAFAYFSGSPAIEDIDGDSDLEIVAGTVGATMYAWHHDGKAVSGWPKSVYNIEETPTLADLDGDGDKEIIIAIKGTLYVWNHDGSNFPNFPVKMGEIPYSYTSPAVADIDNDGDLEIITDTVIKLFAYHHNGTIVSGWPFRVLGTIRSSPAVGNIDLDPELEIVIGAQSKVYTLNHDGTLLSGWPRTVEGNSPVNTRVSSPAIVDIDNDLEKEIIIGAGLSNYNGPTYIYAFNPDGSQNVGWPKQLPYLDEGINVIYASPAIDDLDNDGKLELIQGYVDGKLYVWNLDSDYNNESIDWNQFHHDIANTGLYKEGYFQNPPVIQLNPIPQYINNNYTISAEVSDSNGLDYCEICVSADSICDSEWTSQNIYQTFSSGEKSGICEFSFQHSAYNDSNYTIAMRVINTRNKIATSSYYQIILDNIKPSISYMNEFPIVEKSETLMVIAEIIEPDGTRTESDKLKIKTVSLNGITVNLTQLSSGYYKADIIAPNQAGEYLLALTVADLAGNIDVRTTDIYINEDTEFSESLRINYEFDIINSFQASIDSHENNHIVFSLRKDGNPEIYYTGLSSDGKLLTYNKRLTNDSYNSLNPSLAVDAQNNIHVVWEDDRDNKEIYYSKLDMNSNVIIDNKRLTSNLFASEDVLIMEKSNNLFMLWIDGLTESRELYFKKLDLNANQIIAEKPLTFNSNIKSYDFKIDDSNNLHIVYQDVNNNLNYLKIDEFGDILEELDFFAIGLNPKLDIQDDSSHIYITFQNNNNNIEYGLFDSSNPEPIILNVITQSNSCSKPYLRTESNSLHFTWQDDSDGDEEIYYKKLNNYGSVLVDNYRITSDQSDSLNPLILLGPLNLFWKDANLNTIYYKTTNQLETDAPLISQLQVTDVEAESAVISWQTDEPSDTGVYYSIASEKVFTGKKDFDIVTNHIMTLTNLEPETEYDFYITSADILGNNALDYNQGLFYHFTTESL